MEGHDFGKRAIQCVKNYEKGQYTVKPAHTVTSIKQPPVFKGHPFLVLS